LAAEAFGSALLRRVLLVGFIVAILCSCTQQPTPRENASGENATVEANDSPGGGSTDGETTARVEEPASERDPAPAEGPASRNTPTRPAVGTNGMVSSAHPLATRAGLEILDNGGNAFDAAVTVAAALNVVEPMMSGIGGYGAFVLYDAQEGETRFLHASSRVPETLDPGVFRPPTPNYLKNRRNARAVSTPGNVNAWEALSEDYGDLEWRTLFDPAIELAENGFVIDKENAGWISSEFAAFPEHARAIYGREGVPLGTGERLVQEDLATSFRTIAEGDASALYEGELGKAMASAVQRDGGFLTTEDLRNNRAEWRDTVGIDYRGYEVLTASPPLTSWNSLVRLGVMSQLEPASMGHNSVAYLDTYAQVTERTFWSRYDYVRDPEVESTPLDLLLSEEYWSEEAAQIDSRASARGNGPSPAFVSDNPEHTTHFVVADHEGNVVSATQTIGNVFGSRVMPEGTGIWLNDSIAYSTFEPEGNPLDVFPGRYRLIGVSPTLVMREGKPIVAIGVQGGHNIPQTIPQMLMNVMDFDMDIQRAIAAPRISFVEPDWIAAESGIPAPLRDELSALGHNVYVEPELGNAHGLTVEYDAEGTPVRFTGGADPRAEGAAIGR
jgi:gamma-glutamyltranspeptidase / glutathione hydrolase